MNVNCLITDDHLTGSGTFLFNPKIDLSIF